MLGLHLSFEAYSSFRVVIRKLLVRLTKLVVPTHRSEGRAVLICGSTFLARDPHTSPSLVYLQEWLVATKGSDY